MLTLGHQTALQGWDEHEMASCLGWQSPASPTVAESGTFVTQIFDSSIQGALAGSPFGGSGPFCGGTRAPLGGPNTGWTSGTGGIDCPGRTGGGPGWTGCGPSCTLTGGGPGGGPRTPGFIASANAQEIHMEMAVGRCTRRNHSTRSRCKGLGQRRRVQRGQRYTADRRVAWGPWGGGGGAPKGHVGGSVGCRSPGT